MKPWNEGDTVVGDTKVHYYHIEGPQPPVVLAHGITDDGLCWLTVANVLADNADIFMLDARSHGTSSAPDHGYNYETMAREMAGAVAELGLERPVLMGHSMGAATVLFVAGLFPELPRAIILEDPPVVWKSPDDEAQDEKHRNELAAWMTGIKRKTRDELFTEVRRGNPSWPETDIEPWVDSKQSFSLNIIDLLHQAPAAEEVAALLKKITCPTLLITADPDRGAILNDADVDDLKTLIPHLVHTHIPGAGHNIRRERFPQYLQTVQRFLSELES